MCHNYTLLISLLQRNYGIFVKKRIEVMKV